MQACGGGGAALCHTLPPLQPPRRAGIWNEVCRTQSHPPSQGCLRETDSGGQRINSGCSINAALPLPPASWKCDSSVSWPWAGKQGLWVASAPPGGARPTAPRASVSPCELGRGREGGAPRPQAIHESALKGKRRRVAQPNLVIRPAGRRRAARLPPRTSRFPRGPGRGPRGGWAFRNIRRRPRGLGRGPRRGLQSWRPSPASPTVAASGRREGGEAEAAAGQISARAAGGKRGAALQSVTCQDTRVKPPQHPWAGSGQEKRMRDGTVAAGSDQPAGTGQWTGSGHDTQPHAAWVGVPSQS